MRHLVVTRGADGARGGVQPPGARGRQRAQASLGVSGLQQAERGPEVRVVGGAAAEAALASSHGAQQVRRHGEHGGQLAGALQPRHLQREAVQGGEERGGPALGHGELHDLLVADPRQPGAALLQVRAEDVLVQEAAPGQGLLQVQPGQQLLEAAASEQPRGAQRPLVRAEVGPQLGLGQPEPGEDLRPGQPEEGGGRVLVVGVQEVPRPHHHRHHALVQAGVAHPHTAAGRGLVTRVTASTASAQPEVVHQAAASTASHGLAAAVHNQSLLLAPPARGRLPVPQLPQPGQ